MCSYISPYCFVYYQWNSILCFTDFVAKLWHFLAFHRLYTKPYSKAAKSLGRVLLFMYHEINESPQISLYNDKFASVLLLSLWSERRRTIRLCSDIL